MFEKTKGKINLRIKSYKKFLFLALVSYLYDKIANRKKGTGNGKYIENVDYEVKKQEK